MNKKKYIEKITFTYENDGIIQSTSFCPEGAIALRDPYFEMWLDTSFMSLGWGSIAEGLSFDRKDVVSVESVEPLLDALEYAVENATVDPTKVYEKASEALKKWRQSNGR